MLFLFPLLVLELSDILPLSLFLSSLWSCSNSPQHGTYSFSIFHLSGEEGRARYKRWVLEVDLNSVSGSAIYSLCAPWVHVLSSETLTSKIKTVPAYCLRGGAMPQPPHPYPAGARVPMHADSFPPRVCLPLPEGSLWTQSLSFLVLQFPFCSQNTK